MSQSLSSERALQRERLAHKAIAHFWAIWGNCGPFWVIFGPLRIILGHSRAILGHFGSYLGHFGPFWVIFGPFCGIFGQICGKVNFFAGSLGSRYLLSECMLGGKVSWCSRGVLLFEVYREEGRER